jgi:hypothetical protein
VKYFLPSLTENDKHTIKVKNKKKLNFSVRLASSLFLSLIFYSSYSLLFQVSSFYNCMFNVNENLSQLLYFTHFLIYFPFLLHMEIKKFKFKVVPVLNGVSSHEDVSLG